EQAAGLAVEIVPGKFNGTDGEMDALAGYLRSNTAIQKVALVTSPYHLRRVANRFRLYAPSETDLVLVPGRARWSDRMPWLVLGELGKMGRDAGGLSRAPFLSRNTPISRGETVLVLLSLVMAYAWIGYPAFILCLGSRRRRKRNVEGPDAAVTAALFAAHNEEAHIEERLRNLVSLEPALASIHVGVDGSTDRTADIAKAFAEKEPRVHVHEFPEQRGKSAVIRDLVSVCGEGPDKPEILLFTDANTFFRPDALGHLLAAFAESDVGGVCGRLVFHSGDATGGHAAPTSEGFLWRCETGLKAGESRLDSCLGANGAIYAIRRELFWHDFPANTVVDDFVIGMKVREQGYRMVFESEAVADEELPGTSGEWTRRVRIGSGDFQALVLCVRCLCPRYGVFAWMFFSHKVLRWFTPHTMVLFGLASFLLLYRHGWGEPGVRGSMGGTLGSLVVGTTLALWGVGRLLRGVASRFAAPLRFVDHFMTIQAALFAGFLRFCAGDLKGYWRRTER
ncbi:MAG: glycosyltransferase, partial [Lentisphaerae bacterium]|nr:glycosyltransferase [Lentisphaerota bacterium]